MENMDKEIAAALGGRKPIKLPSGEMTTEYQEWKVVFGDAEKKGRRMEEATVMAE